MKCSFCEKTEDVCRIKKIGEFYYCPKHLTRHYRHQDMYAKSIYDANEYILYEDYAEIVLCDKDGVETSRALIDLDCVDMCKQYKWHLRKGHGDTNYVIASLPNNEKIHLHRLIMNYNGERDIDHINRNGLDNRKSNLRIVDHSNNLLNNKHTGIYQVGSGRYRASCCKNYKTIYIGTYDTFEEAANARTQFLKELQNKTGQ